MAKIIVLLGLLSALSLVAWASPQDEVRRAGYRVESSAGYGSAPLQVLLAVDARSGDGYAKKAFFFYRGRYLGTDTTDSSAGLSLMWQDSDTVALMYILYRPEDPMCCPTGGGAIVRYHWNGSKLVPLDPIPSTSVRR